MVGRSKASEHQEAAGERIAKATFFCGLALWSDRHSVVELRLLYLPLSLEL